MPRADFPHFDHFLRGVQRRSNLVRLIECIGRSLAIACALAAPSILLLAWREAPAMESTLFILALGVLAGVGWSLSHPTTPLAAAMAADRQLGLADLLGTALLFGHDASDLWKRAVLAQAETRCRDLSASSILLRRLSPRAWSGIALAIGFVVILSAWIGAPAQTLAHGVSASSAPAPLVRNDARPLLEPIETSSRISAAPPDGQDAPNQPATEQNKPDASASVPRSTSPGNPSAAVDAHGGALSRGNTPQFVPSPGHEGIAVGRPSALGGRPAGGNGEATTSPAGFGSAGGSVSPGSASSSDADPWRSAGWPNAVESAQHQIDAGQTPQNYRDLIREYFERH